jgi:hypothetical protein
MVNAALALQFSDQLESALGLSPSKADEEQLRQSIPHIRRVEREVVVEK